ncbi:dextranase [Oecophyllibacter saccharovorans]|uniref:Dextranase n=2 Tax=Oecophyllibacter saccharovorans TaxID=2558360 RepID=A0A506ULW7_9PROT|nr:dextranase [Oecophyllibacter saccharovorans]
MKYLLKFRKYSMKPPLSFLLLAGFAACATTATETQATETPSTQTQPTAQQAALPQPGPRLTGPLLESVNTDISHYASGQPVTLQITLHNRLDHPFTGTLHTQMSGRGVKVGPEGTLPVASLAPGETRQMDLPLSTRGLPDWQGYYLDLSLTDTQGHEADRQAGAIDVSPDWATYPRQCWVTATWTRWGNAPPVVKTPPDENVHGFNAWHCNNLQLYNILYRWHYPWVPEQHWVNGDGEDQSEKLVLDYIQNARKYHMGTLMYFPLYAVNVGIAPNFMHDHSGVQLSWGMFTAPCGDKCTLKDLWKFTDNIGYMDPNNIDWQNYWIDQARRWQKKYGFDGIFIDTYGTIYRPLWNSKAQRIIMDRTDSTFLIHATNALHLPMTFNPAGAYNEQDLVQSGREVYHFDELWNNPTDIGNFGDFLTKARQVWQWAHRTPRNIGLDWDMGMAKKLFASRRCEVAQNSPHPCTFNLPGVLYQEGTMLAVGAHHAWLADGDRFISNDDFPIGRMLPTTPEMIQAEYDYQTFGVANEKLLRLNIHPAQVAAPTVENAPASTQAAPGKIWLIQNHRSGFDVLHLLNYTKMSPVSFHDVSDLEGIAAPAEPLKDLRVRMYVSAPRQLGTLYFASPDLKHGQPQVVKYQSGQDRSGRFITFTVPELHYWDMLWLENGVKGSDYRTP